MGGRWSDFTLKMYLVSLFCMKLIIAKQINVNMPFCAFYALLIHWYIIFDTKSVADTTHFATVEEHSPI